MKKTKRKGFNFFRSYYDVYNELEKNDKLLFIDALLDKQFLGIDPKGLKGMVNFAYISQMNSIESQVKGYEDKTKSRLDGRLYIKGENTPPEPPCYGVETPPTVQVEEKGKEEVEVQDVKEVIDFKILLSFINKQTKREFKVINDSVKNKFKARLKEGYSKEDISNTVINSCKDPFHKEHNFKYLTPEYFSRSATMDKFSAKVVKDKAVTFKNPYPEHNHKS